MTGVQTCALPICKKLKTSLLYSFQEYNPDYGLTKRTCLSNIFVADILYKFTNRFSTRVELQYLTSQENEKDWMAGMIEVNYSPNWSVFVSDMYNSGETKIHYYNLGVAYTASNLRAGLNYGRVRDGYVCSGGVCRRTPAYTGLNLSLVFLY